MTRPIFGAIVALLLACGQGSTAGDVMVHVGHNSIEPAEVRIAVGQTVIFHNMDEMPGGHTIVSADGSFSSPPLAKDERWSHTFEKAGTFGFVIQQHPKATGRVVVR